jgi:hypothetical protein
MKRKEERKRCEGEPEEENKWMDKGQRAATPRFFDRHRIRVDE